MLTASTASPKKSWQTSRQRVSVLAELAIRKETVSRKLAELREAHNLTQERAAAHVGVTMRQWQRWEGGASVPYPRNLDAIAEKFDISVQEFFDEPRVPSRDGAGDGSQLDRIEQLLQTGVDRLEQIGEERRRQQEEIIGRIEALEKALIQQAEAQTTKAIAAAVKRIAAEYAARQAPAAGPKEAAPVAQGSSRRRSRQAQSQGTSSAR